MTLYALKREYEERRQALIDKLKGNGSLDPAVQHQLYGAIKEIDTFLQAIEFRIAQEQQRSLDLDLQRDRPRPLAERTKRLAGKVGTGTKKVFKERIPAATAKVTAGPRRYIAKRRARKKLKRQVERELRARLAGLPTHLHEDVPPELPQAEDDSGMSGTVTDVRLDTEGPVVSVEEQRIDPSEDEPQQVLDEPVKKPKVTPVRKPSRKTSKKARKKTSSRKKPTVKRTSKKKVAKKAVRKTAKKAAKKKTIKKASRKKTVKQRKK